MLRLFNLQLGRRSACNPESLQNLQVVHGRTLREIVDAAKDYAMDNEIEKFPIAEGVLGNGANANFQVFVNIRININTPGVQSVVLRIRYPIFVRVGETIGGLTPS